MEKQTVRDFDRTYPTDFRPIKYVRSTDNGKTWVSSATLTGEKWNIAPIDRPDNMNEIYIGQMRLEPANRHHRERIAISYTLAGGGPEGHLHDRYHKNMYYCTFNPRNQHFYSVDGKDLGVGRSYGLPAEHAPRLTPADAVPTSNARLEQRVPGVYGLLAPPQAQRRSRTPARVLGVHAPDVAIIGDERLRRVAQCAFRQHRPMFQPLPRGAIAVLAAG